jgi:predicted ATPase
VRLSKSLIRDGIKDYVIHISSEKDYRKRHVESPERYLPEKNENRVMALRKQLRGTKQAKGEGVVPYLTKSHNSEMISQQLARQ